MEAALPVAKGPYHDVRALKRGLQILEALGQVGWAKPTALSSLAGIDRSSTYRLLSTLQEAGYVVRREDDGAFSLTARVKILADGFTDADKLSQIAANHLQNLTSQISWPCDCAILVGGEGIIVESTHRLSPMSMHRAMIGKRRSLITSALGRAMLCALSDEEREVTLNLLKQMGGADAAAARDDKFIRRILREFEANGYTAVNGAVESKVSAIAVPIRFSSSVVGAINVIFFRSALTLSQAAERYLPRLKQCADSIMRDLSESDRGEVCSPVAVLPPAWRADRMERRDLHTGKPPKRGSQPSTGSFRSAVLANKAAP